LQQIDLWNQLDVRVWQGTAVNGRDATANRCGCIGGSRAPACLRNPHRGKRRQYWRVCAQHELDPGALLTGNNRESLGVGR
jgi:hypothetical protein